MSLETWYWRLFNLSVRLVGLAFTAGGALVLTVLARGTPDMAGNQPIASVFSAIIVAIGILLLRVRTYRPDLGDEIFSIRSRASAPHRPPMRDRSWWTGDERPRAPDGAAT